MAQHFTRVCARHKAPLVEDEEQDRLWCERGGHWASAWKVKSLATGATTSMQYKFEDSGPSDPNIARVKLGYAGNALDWKYIADP